MSKTKSSKGEDKTSSKALNKVKDAGVTKPSQAPKSKSKEIARKVAAKEEKSKKKKGKKEPTPEPSSSESDSDEEMKSSDSSSSSESESEDEKPTKQVVAKVKTEVKSKAKSDSESESESDSDSSSSEDEKEVPKKAVGKAAPKVEASKGKSDSEESDSSESSSESEDSSSEEVPAKAEKVAKKPAEVNGKDKASDDDSSDSSEASAADSDDSSESEDSDESSDEAPKTQKRKAESEEAPAAKKSKTEESAAAPEAAQESGNLFIGNLSWNVDEEWLRQEFEEFGELIGARIVTERETGRSRGFGYVEFAKASDAEKAHAQKKDVELDGRKMNVDYANARTNPAAGKDRAQSRAQNFGDQTSPESDTLFVGNIAFSANEDSLHEAFSEHGDIQGIRLPTDPESGRPKGFGYVQFSSVDEARGALNALQGSEVGGRPIRVDFSTPRQNNGDSPRGGGRGGRGGDRGGRGGGFRGGRGARGGDRGGRGGRGDRGGGRGVSTNRGGFGDFAGKKITF